MWLRKKGGAVVERDLQLSSLEVQYVKKNKNASCAESNEYEKKIVPENVRVRPGLGRAE